MYVTMIHKTDPIIWTLIFSTSIIKKKVNLKGIGGERESGERTKGQNKGKKVGENIGMKLNVKNSNPLWSTKQKSSVL